MSRCFLQLQLQLRQEPRLLVKWRRLLLFNLIPLLSPTPQLRLSESLILPSSDLLSLNRHSRPVDPCLTWQTTTCDLP